MLLLLFAIEAGLLSGNERILDMRYDYPEPTYYLTIEVDAQAGVVFVAGAIETHAVFAPENGVAPGFNPYHAVYTFAAGLRYGPFEAGWRHVCAHDIVSGAPRTFRGGGEDRLYLRAAFKVDSER